MDKELIVMAAATILSGIHGSSGNHTSDTIKKAVSIAAEIVKEADAMLAVPPQPPAQ